MILIPAASASAQQAADPIGAINAIIVDSGGLNVPNTLYVAADQAWKSEDDGANWTQRLSGKLIFV